MQRILEIRGWRTYFPPHPPRALVVLFLSGAARIDPVHLLKNGAW